METFEKVLDQFKPMIFGCIRKLGIYKNHDAFIQAGMIGLWQAWQRFDASKGEFAPFAYRSIYGSLLDELKKEAQEEKMIPAEDQMLEFMFGKQLQTYEWSEKTLEAIAQLNRKERQLIHLLFVDGCSLEEVALEIGITKAGIKKRRERTLGKLRQNLTH